MSEKTVSIMQGAGAPVVLIHGMGFGADYWTPQIEALAKKYHVIAWNMPGYGGAPALPHMSFPALTESLLTLLDSMAVSKAHIIGHSMGGMVALDFAATYPDRVRTLTLFGASPAFPPPDSDFTKAFVKARLAPLEAGGDMADAARETERDHFGPETNMQGRKIAFDCMSACPPDVYRQSLECLQSFDRRDALPTLAMPTLVIGAEVDINAPAKGAEKMAARIPGAEYICLPGLGHLANLEAPDAFNRVILDFLARH